MRIKRLYIGDFGIFRNQSLEDIAPGMVVIGGHNRAGKSTFMNVLRYLGYGFPQGRKLPPPNGKAYEVEADLETDGNTVYNLKIRGFSKPIVTRSSGDERDFNSDHNLYGIDEFTYQQLFTIDLNQLDKIPREISGKDVEKLQSILLGAGFSELIRLPVLEEYMAKEADRIGGKRGNPSVKLFKPYYNQIQEGVQLKKKALEQVEEYQSKREEISILQEKIKQKEEEIEKLRRLELQLDAVRENFDLYEKKKELQLDMELHPGRHKADGFPIHILDKVKILADTYKELKKQCAQLTDQFKQTMEGTISNDIKEKLLARKEQLERWYIGASGIREQIRQYTELYKEYKRKKDDLIVQLQGLNRNWKEADLEKISNLPIDKIERSKFLETLDKYKTLMEDMKDTQQSINEHKENEKQLLKRLETMEDTSLNLLIKRYSYGAAILILVGVISAIFNWGVGLLLAIAGIIGTGLFYFIKINSKSGETIRKQELEVQLESTRIKLESLIARNESLAQEWKALNTIVSEYKALLGLKPDISPDLLKEYYNGIGNVRERYLELNNIKRQLDELEGWLKQRLGDLVDLLMELEGKTQEEIGIDYQSVISQSEYIFAKLAKLHKSLNVGLDLEKKEQELNSIEAQLKHLVSSWEEDIEEDRPFEERLEAFIKDGARVVEYLEMEREWAILNRQLFHAINMERVKNAIFANSTVVLDGDDENFIIKEFEKLCYKYASKDQIEKEWQENKKELQKLMEELDKLKEDRLKVQGELERLSTMENLEKAQKQIDNGRSGLRPLAYQYAVYSTAAFLIRNIRENLVGSVKDMVLGKAAQILNRITSGDYVDILPPENWMEPDFKTVDGNGIVQETADILSQGTKEQLYLAVRISRILDINPALPIILDDCMANFDCRHIKESIKIFAELSERHQIFVLTCHPELVEAVADNVPDAQYWFLERGRFQISEPSQLITQLR